MKKVIKLISLLLSVVLIFASCSAGKSNDAAEQIKDLITEKKYSEAKEYYKSLDSGKKSEIKGQISEIILADFDSMVKAENLDLNNIYDLSAFGKQFTENCRGLWNLAEFTAIDKNAESYKSYIFLKYFAVADDLMRYRELYSLMKDVNSAGYLDTVSNALYDYDQNGNSDKFELCYNKASAYDYSGFNPQEYMISEFRTEHDALVESLKKLSNGFTVNESSSIAVAITDLYDNMTFMLKAADTLKAVNSKLKTIFTIISKDNIFAEIDTEIKITEREYTPGLSMSLDYIFGTDSEFIDNSDIPAEGNSKAQDISKEDAVKRVISAINDTKSYNGNINVTLTEKRNIQLTGYNTGADIDIANSLTMSKVNEMLDQVNGTRNNSTLFKDGINGSETLSNYLPPVGQEASLSPDYVSEYTAVEGSGGFVITLTLLPETGEKNAPAVNNASIVNLFKIDTLSTTVDYETKYSPTKIMAVINGDGLLVKYQYTIFGENKCDFAEANNTTESAEFTFDSKYFFEFEY